MRKILGLGAAVFLLSTAIAYACGNTGASCSAARTQCMNYCAAKGLGTSCTSDCSQAFAGCKQNGSWNTGQCNRTGLSRS